MLIVALKPYQTVSDSSSFYYIDNAIANIEFYRDFGELHEEFNTKSLKGKNVFKLKDRFLLEWTRPRIDKQKMDKLNAYRILLGNVLLLKYNKHINYKFGAVHPSEEEDFWNLTFKRIFLSAEFLPLPKQPQWLFIEGLNQAFTMKDRLSFCQLPICDKAIVNIPLPSSSHYFLDPFLISAYKFRQASRYKGSENLDLYYLKLSEAYRRILSSLHKGDMSGYLESRLLLETIPDPEIEKHRFLKSAYNCYSDYAAGSYINKKDFFVGGFFTSFSKFEFDMKCFIQIYALWIRDEWRGHDAVHFEFLDIQLKLMEKAMEWSAKESKAYRNAFLYIISDESCPIKKCNFN